MVMTRHQGGMLAPRTSLLQCRQPAVRERRSPRRCVAAASRAGGGEDNRVLIVGAGIAGLALAAGLHKVGIPCLVLESSPELRQAGNAIGLWPNAFRALTALGLAEGVREGHDLLRRCELCASSGRLLRGFATSESLQVAEPEFRTVRRLALLRALAGAVAPERLRFGAKVVSVAEVTGPGQAGVEVRLEGGEQVRGRVLVGCDGGANSVVAQHLRLPRPKYAGYVGYRGLRTFPAGQLPTQPGVIRYILGSGVRAGLVPMNATTVYWFTTANAPEAEVLRDPAACKARILADVGGWGFDMASIVRDAPLDSLQRSRIFDRSLPAGKPWGRGLVTGCGDCIHVSTPNLGQGGCSALEDAVELTRTLRLALEAHSADPAVALSKAGPAQLAAALRAYETGRSPRTAALVRKAWALGAAAQIPFPPVTLARDLYISKLLPIKSFFSHVQYDCGTL